MSERDSKMLTPEELDAVAEFFQSNTGQDEMDMANLHAAFKNVGMNLPNYEVRQLMDTLDLNSDGKISLSEFERVYTRLKAEKDKSRAFKKAISSRNDIQQTAGSTDGITHTIKDSERLAFSDWINSNLSGDPDCENLLPIDPAGDDLFEKVKDGILLCKLINHSVEGTIDERTINKKPAKVFLRTENQNLALNSARAIGCNVVNIGSGDIEEGRAHLVLGLLWQVIRIGLLSEVNLAENPGLVLLLQEGETKDDLMKLSPEQILIRWVNYHLEKAGESRRIANFSSDIKDSEVYFHLLSQIAPAGSGVTKLGMNDQDLKSRAESMLQEADKIGCRAFVTPDDVVNGQPRLNLAFVANLFNTYPALDKPEEADDEEFLDETREEKTYRNWMNSLGVDPYVHRLHVDLQSSLVLFQLYDACKPGIVDWKRVHKTFSKLKGTFEKIENGNYAVNLGKELMFSLVGTDGSDICGGNKSLTLGLVWQLMRAYTVAMLKKCSDDGSPIDDSIIVSWANGKLEESGKKCRVSSFKDPSLSDGVTILHLIDSIAAGKVKWDLVKEDPNGLSDEDKMMNAKYAISMGRKIGARIYALPEDIVEVKQRMVMTIFACLMGVGWKKGDS